MRDDERHAPERHKDGRARTLAIHSSAPSPLPLRQPKVALARDSPHKPLPCSLCPPVNMKASFGSFLVAALATAAAAEKINTSMFDAEYLQASNAPNAVSMSVVRGRKTALREQQIANGDFDVDRYEVAAATGCTDGKAGEYTCNNVDLKAFLRHQDMGSRTREGNDVWGTYSWTINEAA